MIDSKKLSKIVLLGTITVSVAFLPMLKTIAQTPTSQTQKSLLYHQKSTWETLWEMVKSRIGSQKNFISRGGEFCVIAPGQLGETQLIWNTQPMFFWANSTNPTRLEFRVYSPFNPQEEQTVLWRKRLTTVSPVSEFQSVEYLGQNLENSQTYKWEYKDLVENKTINGNFKLLSVEDHQRIAEDLTALEIKLQKQGKTAEEISVEKSAYFANKDLWYDALQELSLVNNPSAIFVSQRQLFFNSLCGRQVIN